MSAPVDDPEQLIQEEDEDEFNNGRHSVETQKPRPSFVFYVREVSSNALVTPGCFRDETGQNLFAKVAKVNTVLFDSVQTDGFNSMYLKTLNMGVRSRHVLDLKTVEYVDEGFYRRSENNELEKEFSTTTEPTEMMALIYECSRGRDLMNGKSEFVAALDLLQIVHDFVQFLKFNAHEFGMMHNDLHNGNVMYDPESESLTMVDYGRVTLFSGIQDSQSLRNVADGTLLELYHYDEYDRGALPHFPLDDVDVDHPLVKYRYIPDLMNFSMHLYMTLLSHGKWSRLKVSWLRKQRNGVFIGVASKLDKPNSHPILEPILEGMLAYAHYTAGQGLPLFDMCNIYAPIHRGRERLERFLVETWPGIERTIPDIKNGAYNTSHKKWWLCGGGVGVDGDDPVSRVDVSQLFPTSLADAYEPKWRDPAKRIEAMNESLHLRNGPAAEVWGSDARNASSARLSEYPFSNHASRPLLTVGAGDVSSKSSNTTRRTLSTTFLFGATVVIVAASLPSPF